MAWHVTQRKLQAARVMSEKGAERSRCIDAGTMVSVVIMSDAFSLQRPLVACLMIVVPHRSFEARCSQDQRDMSACARASSICVENNVY